MSLVCLIKVQFHRQLLHPIHQFLPPVVRRVLTTRRTILLIRTKKETLEFKTQIIKRLQQLVKLEDRELFPKNSDILEMTLPMSSASPAIPHARVQSSKLHSNNQFSLVSKIQHYHRKINQFLDTRATWAVSVETLMLQATFLQLVRYLVQHVTTNNRLKSVFRMPKSQEKALTIKQNSQAPKLTYIHLRIATSESLASLLRTAFKRALTLLNFKRKTTLTRQGLLLPWTIDLFQASGQERSYLR